MAFGILAPSLVCAQRVWGFANMGSRIAFSMRQRGGQYTLGYKTAEITNNRCFFEKVTISWPTVTSARGHHGYGA